MSARHSERGVTLIELLVALALLAFVLLGITPLFMASVKSNFSANEYTSIHVLARDRLEQLMNLPFTDPQLAAGDHCVALPATLPTGALNPFQHALDAAGNLALDHRQIAAQIDDLIDMLDHRRAFFQTCAAGGAAPQLVLGEQAVLVERKSL